MIISITTTSAADQYGLQVASLSQDGDDGDAPTFIAPTSASLLAGEGSMTSDATGVLQPDPGTTAPGAYPLTMLTYAATDPATLSTAAKQGYAALLTYAARHGQSQGPDPGQLPPGYVPLPATLAAQTKAAAAALTAQPSKGGPPTTSPDKAPSTVPGGEALPGSVGYGSDPSGPVPSDDPTAQSPAARKRAGPTNQPIGPNQLAAVRSPMISVGVVRWAVPGVLSIGLGAGAAAMLLSIRRRRPRLAAGPDAAAGDPEPRRPVRWRRPTRDGTDGAS
jgi:hypothetical protein